MKAFYRLPEALQAYISQRGGEYGIPPHELLMKIPANLHDNAIELYQFLKSKDISHLIATSNNGDPAEFSNWIFEDAAANRARQADPMAIEDYLDAQLDNHVDATQIEFGTPDPGSPGYNQVFSEAFGFEPAASVDLNDFVSTLSGEGVGKSVIVAGQPIQVGAMDATNQLWDGLGESLAEVGIPVTYVAMKGFGGVLPFMRSIDWKKFRECGHYRQSTLARALRVFREGGWKTAAKAIVIGFMISAFEPMAYFIAAVGLTGVAAMGTRWLANKVLKFSGPVATALNKIADLLASAHAFLKRALDTMEKVVEVVIEVATNVTKKVVKAGAQFANAVYQVSKDIAVSAVKATVKAAKIATSTVSQIANRVSGWIFSWFYRPSYV
ncbi:hypothetical protein FQK07_14710 [Synechococcus sp. BSF8S]|uniref:hypothetical protein n=1 Tax=Synechococcales TaxID=1890424 RepID=UPI001627A028|nr:MULTISPECIES: hypothetical protein [unclassified Synechococcus]MBC1262476.1 hypothetical protein [Synechococcus sp. BSF8S]MBC1265359.1 hypothetical protein [Synechococcus sp. BSA11S]